MKEFTQYTLAIKVTNMTKANQTQILGHIENLRKCHLDMLHHVILLQTETNAQNNQIIELQKVNLQTMNNAKESETKIVKNLEEKTQTIVKLQEDAIKKAEAIAKPNNSKMLSPADFDETWKESEWEKVKPKNKTNKEKPLTYANVASNNLCDIKEPFITAGKNAPSKNSNHIMLLNPQEKGPKMNNEQFVTKKVIIQRALDEIRPRIQVNNITTT